MSRIFISHRNTPADNAWAAKVHGWIKEQKGIHGFLDFDVEDGIEAGEEWEKKIYASMNAAQVVIAIVSKDWLASDWCVSEARMARLLGRKLLLIITEECTVPFRDTQSIRFDKHGDEAIVFKELRQALSTTHKRPERPYPGLATFEEKDAAVFFGRENETRELVNRVNSLFQGRPKTPRILLVQGASGSGKSSLMRAGFMSEFTTDPKNLCVGPIIPRGDALDELAEALDTPLDERDPDAAADAVIASLKRANPAYERAVICVDQAEELLDESGAFFDVMRALLEKRRGRVIVLATIRSDFLNEFQTRRLIGEEAALKYATIELDPLPKDHLSAIIREPARLFKVEYDDALFAKICEDHGGPDALPLLAFFLNKFWQDEYVSDGVLQLSEYKDFGGINQALKGAVKEAVESCMAVEPAQKDRQKVLQELREVFLGHLVAVSPGSDSAVRRRAPAEGLTARQVALLKVFADQRLLLEDKGQWEVAHEALLRQWEDLQEWIAAAREDLVAINRIEVAAAQWDREGRRDEDLTHSGSRLEDGFRMRNSPRYAERFDATAKAYLEACRQKEDDRFEKEKVLREAAERERDRAEAAKQAAEMERATAEAAARRALKSQRLGLAALSSVALQNGRADDAAYLALAAWPRVRDPAESLSDYAVVLDALRDALPAQREVRRVALGTRAEFSPDDYTPRDTNLGVSSDGAHVAICLGRDPSKLLLASAEDTGGICWQAIDVDAVPTWAKPVFHGSDLLELRSEYDPDRVLHVGTGRTVLVWDADGYRLAEGIVPSDDGQSLVAEDDPGNALCDGNVVATLSVRGHRDKEIVSPDGRRCFEFWNGGVRDCKTGRLISRLVPQRSIRQAAFHRDNTRISFIDTDGKIWLWDLEPGCEVEKLRDLPRQCEVQWSYDAKELWPLSMELSPDGAFVSLWDCDRLEIYDIVSERRVDVLDIGPLRLPDVYVGAFSACGTLWAGFRLWQSEDEVATLHVRDLRTGLADVLWSASGADLPAPDDVKAKARGVQSLQCSADGTRLIACVAAGDRMEVKSWDIVTGAQIADLTFPADDEGRLPSVVPMADQDMVAVAEYGTDYRLVQTETGSEIAELPGSRYDKLFIAAEGLYAVTPGLWVSTYLLPGGDRISRIYRQEDSEYCLDTLLREILSVCISPNGSAILISEGGYRVWWGDDDFKSEETDDAPFVRLWNAARPEVLAQWALPEDEAERIAGAPKVFAPCGTYVAVLGEDTVTFHDAWTGTQTGRLAPLGEDWSPALARFSRDGTRLAVPCKTVRKDTPHRVDLFDIASGHPIARLDCSGNVTDLTFSHDDKHLLIGFEDGSIHRWNVAFGPGTLLDLVYRRMPVLTPPAIAERFGMELREAVHSGEEPLPNDHLVPQRTDAPWRGLPADYPVPVIAPPSRPWPAQPLLGARLGETQLISPPPGSPLARWGLPVKPPEFPPEPAMPAGVAEDPFAATPPPAPALVLAPQPNDLDDPFAEPSGHTRVSLPAPPPLWDDLWDPLGEPPPPAPPPALASQPQRTDQEEPFAKPASDANPGMPEARSLGARAPSSDQIQSNIPPVPPRAVFAPVTSEEQQETQPPHGRWVLEPEQPGHGKGANFSRIEFDNAITIGRDDTADIVLDAPRVSREHARLVSNGEHVVLHDLGSTYGTYVNGHCVLPGSPMKLEDGQCIEFGVVRFRLRFLKFPG